MSETPPDFTTLFQLLRWRAMNHGSRSAVTFLREGEEEAGTWSYTELDQRARTVAAALLEAQASGRTVLLVYPTGLDFVAAFFGCIYAGAIAVPTNPPRLHRNVHRLRVIAEDSSSTLALTNTETLNRIQPLLPAFANFQWLTTDTFTTERIGAWPEPNTHPDSIAFLQYTSGSTAEPKGVMVSHRNLLANHRMLQNAFDQNENSVWVSWLPLFHDMGLIGSLLQALYCGGHCILMPPEAFLMKPFRWLQAVSKYRAHTSGGPNFAYELCARRISPEQRRQLDLSHWMNAFNGAEPVRPETLHLFQETFTECGLRPAALQPCYGLAEATLFVASTPANVPFKAITVCAEALQCGQIALAKDGGLSHSLVSCGYAWNQGKIRIVHPESSQPCDSQTVGEIWIAGPHVAEGYWKKCDETHRNFQAKISETDEGPFLRTGDLGFVLDNHLYITGRCKDLIIVAGRNHYPTDLEQTAEESHPALRRTGCVAFSITDPGEERLVIVAEIDRTARNRYSRSEIETAIRTTIAEEHQIMPFDVLLVPPGSLHKTTSGKIQRSACRTSYLNGGFQAFPEPSPE